MRFSTGLTLWMAIVSVGWIGHGEVRAEADAVRVVKNSDIMPRCGVCGDHLVVEGVNRLPRTDGPPAPYRGVVRHAEIVLVLDDAFIAIHGENAEAEAAAAFDRAAQLYQNSLSGVYELELIEIICYPHGLPAGITLTDAGNGEISSGDLLSSFGNWQQSNRSTILSMLSPYSYDAAILMSGRDFNGANVGLAYIGGMCVNQFSAGVVQNMPSTDATGNVLAHEIGHTLDMNHDVGQSPSCPASGFVMEAAINLSGPLSNAFSPCSIADTQAWLSGGNGTCMNNDPGSPDWSVVRCGDGHVDGTEECDAGLTLFTGSCCESSSCELSPGCSCPNYEGCCSGGSVLAASTVCRASSGVCDIEDACDGENAACPVDLIVQQGTSCLSSGFDGACYNGDCISTDELCFNSFGTETCSFAFDCSGFLYCNDPSQPGSCVADMFTPDGAECGTNQQCFEDSCVSSASLGSYMWGAGAWSSCSVTEGAGVQVRTVSCVNEAGSSVSEFNCNPSTKPATSRGCGTYSLAEFAVMQSCINSAATGECAFFDLNADTTVDLEDHVLFEANLLGP